MFGRKSIDELLNLHHFQCRIFKSCGSNKLLVEMVRQQRDRKRAEVGLEYRRHGTNIVESVGIPEIKGGIFASLKKLRYHLGLAGTSCLAVNTLVVERCGMRQRASVDPKTLGPTPASRLPLCTFQLDRNLAVASSQVRSDLLGKLTTKHRGS